MKWSNRQCNITTNSPHGCESVVIYWIPAFYDISGNVLADLAAKEAIQMPPLPGIQIPRKDIYRFSSNENGIKIGKICPFRISCEALRIQLYTLETMTPRQDSVIPTRLSIDHATLTCKHFLEK